MNYYLRKILKQMYLQLYKCLAKIQCATGLGATSRVICRICGMVNFVRISYMKHTNSRVISPSVD